MNIHFLDCRYILFVQGKCLHCVCVCVCWISVGAGCGTEPIMLRSLFVGSNMSIEENCSSGGGFKCLLCCSCFSIGWINHRYKIKRHASWTKDSERKNMFILWVIVRMKRQHNKKKGNIISNQHNKKIETLKPVTFWKTISWSNNNKKTRKFGFFPSPHKCLVPSLPISPPFLKNQFRFLSSTCKPDFNTWSQKGEKKMTRKKKKKRFVSSRKVPRRNFNVPHVNQLKL